ncbi:hypothetical protein DMA11_04075 [Marinilabiliaceae bacterium JC017]|nr:hypothetical protein DMA11_04075 [Marinilabiliaceae bacterium JC017]
MDKLREIAAYTLLLAYSIVFAHNIIPHHHHSEQSFLGDAGVALHEHSHDDCSHSYPYESNLKHDHHHQHQSHCHFNVRPILTKMVNIPLVFVTVDEVQLPVPVYNFCKNAFVYYPQKLLESYSFAVPLRAPPVFS